MLCKLLNISNTKYLTTVEKIKAREFDWYVAISRGGLVLACLLAQKTHMKKIDTLCIYSYDNQRQKDIELVPKNYDHLKGQNILLIDDLVDSGKTLFFATEFLEKNFFPRLIQTFVIYKKNKSSFHPDYYLEEVSSEQWITFPWERD